MASTSTTRFVANPVVSCREEGPDGALLFNPDTDDVLVINVTGLVVWEALAQPRTKRELADALVSRCENAPRARVGRDLDPFLEELMGKGFVDVDPGSGS